MIGKVLEQRFITGVMRIGGERERRIFWEEKKEEKRGTHNPTFIYRLLVPGRLLSPDFLIFTLP